MMDSDTIWKTNPKMEVMWGSRSSKISVVSINHSFSSVVKSSIMKGMANSLEIKTKKGKY